jgi:hypothetical protein
MFAILTSSPLIRPWPIFLIFGNITLDWKIELSKIFEVLTAVTEEFRVQGC